MGNRNLLTILYLFCEEALATTQEKNNKPSNNPLREPNYSEQPISQNSIQIGTEISSLSTENNNATSCVINTVSSEKPTENISLTNSQNQNNSQSKLLLVSNTTSNQDLFNTSYLPFENDKILTQSQRKKILDRNTNFNKQPNSNKIKLQNVINKIIKNEMMGSAANESFEMECEPKDDSLVFKGVSNLNTNFEETPVINSEDSDLLNPKLNNTVDNKISIFNPEEPNLFRLMKLKIPRTISKVSDNKPLDLSIFQDLNDIEKGTIYPVLMNFLSKLIYFKSILLQLAKEYALSLTRSILEEEATNSKKLIEAIDQVYKILERNNLNETEDEISEKPSNELESFKHNLNVSFLSKSAPALFDIFTVNALESFSHILIFLFKSLMKIQDYYNENLKVYFDNYLTRPPAMNSINHLYCLNTFNLSLHKNYFTYWVVDWLLFFSLNEKKLLQNQEAIYCDALLSILLLFIDSSKPISHNWLKESFGTWKEEKIRKLLDKQITKKLIPIYKLSEWNAILTDSLVFPAEEVQYAFSLLSSSTQMEYLETISSFLSNYAISLYSFILETVFDNENENFQILN